MQATSTSGSAVTTMIQQNKTGYPCLGGLVDLKQCIVCTTDDIDECHAAYRAKMRRKRKTGERTANQLEPWEHREMKEEKANKGRIAFWKYKGGLAQLASEGSLYDDDSDSDIDDDGP